MYKGVTVYNLYILDLITNFWVWGELSPLPMISPEVATAVTQNIAKCPAESRICHKIYVLKRIHFSTHSLYIGF